MGFHPFQCFSEIRWRDANKKRLREEVELLLKRLALRCSGSSRSLQIIRILPDENIFVFVEIASILASNEDLKSFEWSTF